VFCDIDEKSLCINPDKIEELITDKTKAIMPMDYGSAICAHDQIKKIADKHNLRVIHDAAHSFGSSYNGKKIGTFSDICMFSFDPVKNITCIDGGMLIVNSEEDLKKLHEMRLIGMGQPAKTMYENKRAWTYDVKSLGFRYHMPNLHAAIGIEQLKKIESISESKREVALNYNKSFAKISNLKIPSNPISNSCPFLYYILCSKELRNKLRDYLLNRGVETGIHWQPAYNFSLFENYRAGDLSVTKLIEHEIVSIPIHSQMKYEDYTYVITCIEEFFKDKS
jgi:dTDP-4-amino-4,6-dideoxygalactose transaminase